jgi:hypothetical protein
MKRFKKGYDYPPKDNLKLKELMKSVYDQKLYYEEKESEDSDKKERKHKKKHKKHRKHESSDESPVEDHKQREQEHEEKIVEKPKIKPKPQPNLIDMFDFDSSTKENPPAPADSSWADFSLPTAPQHQSPPPVQNHPETLKKELPPAVVNSNPFENITLSKPVMSSPYHNPPPFGGSLPSGSVQFY